MYTPAPRCWRSQSREKESLAGDSGWQRWPLSRPCDSDNRAENPSIVFDPRPPWLQPMDSVFAPRVSGSALKGYVSAPCRVLDIMNREIAIRLFCWYICYNLKSVLVTQRNRQSVHGVLPSITSPENWHQAYLIYHASSSLNAAHILPHCPTHGPFVRQPSTERGPPQQQQSKTGSTGRGVGAGAGVEKNSKNGLLLRGGSSIPRLRSDSRMAPQSPHSYARRRETGRRVDEGTEGRGSVTSLEEETNISAQTSHRYRCGVSRCFASCGLSELV